MPFFFIEVAVSVVYAFVNLVIGWSGVALRACGLVGALVPIRTGRESVNSFGGIAEGLILARMKRGRDISRPRLLSSRSTG